MRRLIYFLLVVCLSTAVAVVWVRHENRVAYSQLEDEYALRDELNIEWHQLRIELAAFSRFDQLEGWAQSTKKLVKPSEHVVLILPKSPSFRNETNPEQE